MTHEQLRAAIETYATERLTYVNRNWAEGIMREINHEIADALTHERATTASRKVTK